MNIFDVLIIQPIFNLLVLIYGVLPGSDFGISLIILTVIVRLLMWPLVKKQLHQTKMQRAIAPELKKIKTKTKGDKQLESQLMLELYREKGINPLSTIGILFLQIPIFIALYSVVRIMTSHHDQIATYTYSFLQGLGPIHDIITNPTHSFNESLLGVVSLSKTGLGSGQTYWPLIVLAVIAAILQYYQTKQISPQPTEHKRLRDVMQASADGKDVDQAEISAIMTQRMNKFFPIMTFMVLVYLPGAITLYTVVSSIVAVIQQRYILQQDVDEMGKIAGSTTETRVKQAVEAEIVSEVQAAAKKTRGNKRSKRRNRNG